MLDHNAILGEFDNAHWLIRQPCVVSVKDPDDSLPPSGQNGNMGCDVQLIALGGPTACSNDAFGTSPGHRPVGVKRQELWRLSEIIFWPPCSDELPFDGIQRTVRIRHQCENHERHQNTTPLKDPLAA